jgi:hypothetical protein
MVQDQMKWSFGAVHRVIRKTVVMRMAQVMAEEIDWALVQERALLVSVWCVHLCCESVEDSGDMGE